MPLAFSPIRDTAANRPAANAVPAGTVFFATDTLVWSESNGSAWANIVPPADSMLSSIGAITAEPMGFENNAAVTITYDKSARTVTLTQSGGVVIYWKGIRRVLTSPWTSPAHDDTSGAWFLSAKADADPTWTQVVWDFATEAMVAYVQYVAGGSGRIFALREMHGFMPWQDHKEFHEQIGCYRRSGGDLTAGTYEIGGTATDARNSPGFDSAVIADEDLPSTLTAWSEGTYSNMYFNGTSTAVIDVAATLPYRTGVTYPKYGSPTAAETEMVTGRFFNVYQILMPTTGDADSQKYRVLILQPQTQFTTLAAAQAEDFRSLALGDFTGISPEFVAYARITYGTGSGVSYSGATGSCRIEAVSYLTGPKASQVVSSAVTPASHTVLSDRSVADQHPASAITNTPANGIVGTTTQAALNELALSNAVEYTDSHTLVIGDALLRVEMNKGTANNLTVPPNADVAFPVGTKIDVLQTGAGQTTLVAGSGVTINAAPGLKLTDQWSACTLIKRATNTWVAIGRLSA